MKENRKGKKRGGWDVGHKRIESQFKHSYTVLYSLKKHIFLAQNVLNVELEKAEFKIFKVNLYCYYANQND